MYPLRFNFTKDDIVVLPPDDVEQVKASEMSDPNRSNPNWTCAHCTVHFGDYKLREIVKEHLESVYVSTQLPQSTLTNYLSTLSRHGIHSPREPEDLFIFGRNQHLQPFQADYWVTSSR